MTDHQMQRPRSDGPFPITGVVPPGMPCYKAFADFGGGYDSSMEGIRTAAQTAQKTKGANGKSLLTKELRHARKLLNVSRKRLTLDLFHVQLNAAVFEPENSTNHQAKETSE